MNFDLIVMVILLVLLVGIYMLISGQVKGELASRAKVVENFNNPNLLSLGDRLDAKIICQNGPNYAIRLENFILNSKTDESMKVQVTARFLMTETKGIFPGEIQLPMSSEMSAVTFNHVLGNNELISKNGVILTLMFWKDETDTSCYHQNMDKDSTYLLGKCANSYLGSADIMIPKEKITIGDCATGWTISGASPNPTVLNTYLGSATFMGSTDEYKLDSKFMGQTANNDNSLLFDFILYSKRGSDWQVNGVTYYMLNGNFLGTVTSTSAAAPPNSYTRQIYLKLGDVLTIGTATTPNRNVAQVQLAGINNQVITLDVGSLLSNSGAGVWTVDDTIIKTVENYEINKISTTVLSHTGTGTTARFTMKLRSSYRNYVYNTATSSIAHTAASADLCQIDISFGETKACGPYTVTESEMNWEQNKITLTIEPQASIKNIRKGDAGFCQSKQLAIGTNNACSPYEGQCTTDADCSGSETGIACSTVITGIKACCLTTGMDDCRVKYSEWLSRQNNYDTWADSGYATT